MIRKIKDYNNILLEILNKLFIFSIDNNNNKEIIINPDITENNIINITNKTKNTILELYTFCEESFIKGIKIYESIILNQQIETNKSLISNLKEQQSNFFKTFLTFDKEKKNRELKNINTVEDLNQLSESDKPSEIIEPPETSEEPEETSEEPKETSEEPEKTSEEPEETSEEPEKTSEEPEKTSEEPEETSEEPSESSEEPPETSEEEPSESSKEPEETSEEPPETIKEPEESSKEPEETSEEPPETIKEPEETSKEPDTSEEPNTSREPETSRRH